MIPKRIAVLGGSTVYGQGDPTGGGFVALLRAWHESNFPEENRVFNLGVGGDGVIELRKRGPGELLARRAELIVLYPGLNDTRRVGGSSSPTQLAPDIFEKELNALVTELQSIAPVILMSAVPPDEELTTPYRKWHFLTEDARRATEIVAATAAKHSLPYLPVFESWSEDPDSAALLADGLHCSGAGHRLLFAQLKNLLEAQ